MRPYSFSTRLQARYSPCPMRFLMHDLTHRVTHFSGSRTRLALLAWTLLQVTLVSAQDQAERPLVSSPSLQEQIPPSSSGALPTFIFGEHLFGRPDGETVVEGAAMLRLRRRFPDPGGRTGVHQR